MRLMIVLLLSCASVLADSYTVVRSIPKQVNPISGQAIAINFSTNQTVNLPVFFQASAEEDSNYLATQINAKSKDLYGLIFLINTKDARNLIVAHDYIDLRDSKYLSWDLDYLDQQIQQTKLNNQELWENLVAKNKQLKVLKQDALAIGSFRKIDSLTQEVFDVTSRKQVLENLTSENSEALLNSVNTQVDALTKREIQNLSSYISEIRYSEKKLEEEVQDEEARALEAELAKLKRRRVHLEKELNVAY